MLTGCTHDEADDITYPTDNHLDSAHKLGSNITYTPAKNTDPEDSDTQAFTKASNALGTDVASAISKESDPDANVAFSPYALSMALTTLSEGASGQLAKTVDERYSLPAGKRAETANRLITIMKEHEPKDVKSVDLSTLPRKPIFHSANHLVLLNNFDPQPAYITSIRKNLDAEITLTNAHDASKILDSWALVHSGKMIEKSAIRTTPDTRFIIQNGTFFASQWSDPFDENDTHPGYFTTASQQKITTDFMKSDQFTTYILNDDWVGVNLPYSGNDFEATVMMSRHKKASHITSSEIEELLPSFEDITEVEVYMPIIHVRQSHDVLDALSAAGIDVKEANCLDGIKKDLMIAQSRQQVAIDITEEGTRAAAVQEFEGEAMAPPPEEKPVVRFDHPYIFQVRHIPTGALLFHLIVNNPNMSQ